MIIQRINFYQKCSRSIREPNPMKNQENVSNDSITDEEVLQREKTDSKKLDDLLHSLSHILHNDRLEEMPIVLNSLNKLSRDEINSKFDHNKKFWNDSNLYSEFLKDAILVSNLYYEIVGYVKILKDPKNRKDQTQYTISHLDQLVIFWQSKQPISYDLLKLIYGKIRIIPEIPEEIKQNTTSLEFQCDRIENLENLNEIEEKIKKKESLHPEVIDLRKQIDEKYPNNNTETRDVNKLEEARNNLLKGILNFLEKKEQELKQPFQQQQQLLQQIKQQTQQIKQQQQQQKQQQEFQQQQLQQIKQQLQQTLQEKERLYQQQFQQKKPQQQFQQTQQQQQRQQTQQQQELQQQQILQKKQLQQEESILKTEVNNLKNKLNNQIKSMDSLCKYITKTNISYRNIQNHQDIINNYSGVTSKYLEIIEYELQIDELLSSFDQLKDQINNRDNHNLETEFLTCQSNIETIKTHKKNLMSAVDILIPINKSFHTKLIQNKSDNPQEEEIKNELNNVYSGVEEINNIISDIRGQIKDPDEAFMSISPESQNKKQEKLEKYKEITASKNRIIELTKTRNNFFRQMHQLITQLKKLQYTSYTQNNLKQQQQKFQNLQTNTQINQRNNLYQPNNLYLSSPPMRTSKANTVSNGTNVSKGTNVSNGTKVSKGTDVSNGNNVSKGTDVSNGNNTGKKSPILVIFLAVIALFCFQGYTAYKNQ